jgi:branched-chain amino acid aminotransferase
MRIHPKSKAIQAKTSGHYANSILASQEIAKKGFDEALLLDFEGNVAEGPGENIFMVKDNTIKTPTTDNVLKGLTRDCVIQIAKDKGYKVEETKITPEELKSADEAFLTGTAAEITPIGQIDDTIIGEGNLGPVTNSLKSIFTDIINGEEITYNKWLTYV